MKLKVLIIGQEKTGKSMISNFLLNDLKETTQVYRPTTGFRILDCERKVKNPITGLEENIAIDFWDVSGNLRYENTWQVVQSNVDGVIIVTNGDKPSQNQETEAWIKNFPKKMKISPNQCIGLANHPSGSINDHAPLNILSVNFTHCCIESRSTTIGPVIDRFISKLIERKSAEEKN